MRVKPATSLLIAISMALTAGITFAQNETEQARAITLDWVKNALTESGFTFIEYTEDGSLAMRPIPGGSILFSIPEGKDMVHMTSYWVLKSGISPTDPEFAEKLKETNKLFEYNTASYSEDQNIKAIRIESNITIESLNTSQELTDAVYARMKDNIFTMARTSLSDYIGK
jgi:hypothetical protein